MRVLVIGSGGREHALAAALARSARAEQVFCAPGNAGTAEVGENIPVAVEDHEALVQLAREREIGLTVIGPEGPLCAGIVDRFQAAGLRIFGPTKAAARIEGEKAYAKKLMKRVSVPTAEARIFTRFAEARAYVASRDAGVVVKASGLAAGKGVVVCPDPADGLLALERMMVQREFGDAGDVVVVEELFKGQELSVHALVDDRTIYMLESAQDYKAVGDGDTGPNTGGMGAYSPAPIATSELLRVVERDVLVPIVDALRQDGAPYGGVLYAGLMLTAAGPKVLEFNCRFGDPETQVILPRLDCDLLDVLDAVVEGRLEEVEIRWKRKSAVCVVMAAKGYPGKYESGKVIEGLGAAGAMDEVSVFHAGTKRVEHLTVTGGGRVLGVTGWGDDIAAAQRRAYEAVNRIHFEGAYYRRDIANKALSSIVS
ncbi:MAG: phosphoribosylamine--glycine ligase [Phycisphaerales bacterium]|nr:phosphoribosylamine--glycine ligase [Phycisphaerales bacterium]